MNALEKMMNSKEIQNTLLIQNQIMNELKKENANINQKYTQQNMRMNKLESVDNEQSKRIGNTENIIQTHQTEMAKQNQRMNKLESIDTEQHKRIGNNESVNQTQNQTMNELEKRIIALENCIKTQNDLIALMKTEQKEME
eukprot:348042_1